MLKQINALFEAAGLSDVQSRILRNIAEKQNAEKREKCVVFEIGHGRGLVLENISWSGALARHFNDIELVGIDAFRSRTSKLGNVRLRVGNALSKPFPKSDIIFSMWTLGYIGNIGFMVKKAAHALKPNGLAVLHVNAQGLWNSTGSSPLVERMQFVKNPEKLKYNLEHLRLQDCKIRVHRASGPNFERGDLIVVISKQ